MGGRQVDLVTGPGLAGKCSPVTRDREMDRVSAGVGGRRGQLRVGPLVVLQESVSTGKSATTADHGARVRSLASTADQLIFHQKAD